MLPLKNVVSDPHIPDLSKKKLRDLVKYEEKCKKNGHNIRSYMREKGIVQNLTNH